MPTVKQLRTRLKNLGLPTAGNKAELEARLAIAADNLAPDDLDTPAPSVHPSSDTPPEPQPQHLALVVPDTTTAERRVNQLSIPVLEYADTLTILDDEDYAAAGEYLVEKVRSLMAEVDATFDPIIADLHKAHRTALATKRKHLRPLEVAKQAIDSKMASYHRAQIEHQRREEQRLREEAEAEAARIEAAEQVEREHHINTKAEALIAEGRLEEAQALYDSLLEPVDPQPRRPPVNLPALKPRTPKAEGVSVRVYHKWRMLDASKLRREYLIPDERAISATVRGLKDKADAAVSIDGSGGGAIEYYTEDGVASRKGG